MVRTISICHTSGGIPVIIDDVPGSQSSGYMVAVNTGSRDEDPGIFGLSHLLEHTVFRAAGGRDSFQMSKEIEGAGGMLNAFTAKEVTAFYATTIKETADVAKGIVADIVARPALTAKDTELEKEIVLQEISMVENDPESYIHDLFDETIWKGHELSNDEAGLKVIVKGLTDADLRKYYDERYRIPNLAVFASGAVDQDDVRLWAEENFDGMSGGRANPRKIPDVKGSTYRHVKRKDDHCYVGMGFRTCSPKDADEMPLRLLSAVLGSGSSSRLFQSIREEKALVYGVYSTVTQYTDASTLGTFMSATDDNVHEAIMTAAEVYRRLKDEGLAEGELQKARNMAKGSLIRSMESTGNRLYRLARTTMLTGAPQEIDDRLAALDAVTGEDVMRVAQKVLDPKEINVVMYSDDVESMKGFGTDQLDF